MAACCSSSATFIKFVCFFIFIFVFILHCTLHNESFLHSLHWFLWITGGHACNSTSIVYPHDQPTALRYSTLLELRRGNFTEGI